MLYVIGAALVAALAIFILRSRRRIDDTVSEALLMRLRASARD
jgi:hypothetical protein